MGIYLAEPVLAKYVGQELAPVLRDTLSVSTDLLSLAPLPGLEEAAKALLCVWDACQKVDVSALIYRTRIYSHFDASLQIDEPSLLFAARGALCDFALFCPMRN